MDALDCLNTMDLDFSLKDLRCVSDVVEAEESDSGVESINSVSPQDSPMSSSLLVTSSPPPSPLSLSSIHAMLPLTPLSPSQLHHQLPVHHYFDTPDSELKEAEAPVKKQVSLLSCLLSIPPVETASAKQLRLQVSATQDDSFVNFLNSSHRQTVGQCQAPGSSQAQVD